MTAKPVRLPDATSVEAMLAALDPETADAELAPALSQAFQGFSFAATTIDDPYWCNPHDVVAADGTRLGDHRAWVERELAELGGDLTAFWNRHRESELRFSEWRGNIVFAFAPTGPGVADFVQISLGREVEVLAGPIVDPDYRPHGADDLIDPTWVDRNSLTKAQRLAGPVYRLRGRTGGGIVHMKSFLGRRARIEREQREAQRPELKRRDQKREIGFIPRPLKIPAEQLLADEAVSVHRLMERIEAIDAEVGLPFAWFFLMTHGHWVDPDVGASIADGLRAGRVRLPDRDAAVLLAWADKKYLF